MFQFWELNLQSWKSTSLDSVLIDWSTKTIDTDHLAASFACIFSVVPVKWMHLFYRWSTFAASSKGTTSISTRWTGVGKRSTPPRSDPNKYSTSTVIPRQDGQRYPTPQQVRTRPDDRNTKIYWPTLCATSSSTTGSGRWQSVYTQRTAYNRGSQVEFTTTSIHTKFFYNRRTPTRCSESSCFNCHLFRKDCEASTVLGLVRTWNCWRTTLSIVELKTITVELLAFANSCYTGPNWTSIDYRIRQILQLK